MLEIDRLKKAYGGLMAVYDVSFKIEPGEIVGLIGPNGAGKTTVFNLISGYVPADAGRMIFRGQELSGLKPHQIARRELSRTFQGTRVFRKLTVRQNIFIARHSRLAAGSWRALAGSRLVKRQAAETEDRMRALLEFVGLNVDPEAAVGKLPFASQALLGLAMALAAEPKLLLLDEPLAGMTSSEVDNVIALIRSIRAKGITILLIEHNMKAVMRLCDRVVVLNYGRRIAEGQPQEIQAHPEVIRAYLGVET